MKLLLSSITTASLTLSIPLVALPMQLPEAVQEAEVPEGLSATDWSSIHSAYEAHRHSVFATENGFEAHNPAQGWLTRFDGRRATTVPNDGDWTWGLELAAWGYEGQAKAARQPQAIRAEAQRVSHDWDDTLTEWWVNDGRGLEHGFTVHAPPAAALEITGDNLVFELKVLGGLQPEVTANRRGARFLSGNGATVLTYDGLLAFDAEGTDLDTWMEPTDQGLRLVVRAVNARYPITIDPLVQTAYLKASNTDFGDRFGGSVAISGNTVVVGAIGEASDATGVNAGVTAEADNGAGNAGAVYVFVRSGSGWSQEAYIKASNTEFEESFGISVAISGDTLVVGASSEDSNATGVNAGAAAEADNSLEAAGAAYVFVRSGSVWSQEAYIKASNPDQADQFGSSVAISGNTIVVGAWRESSNATGVNAGAAAEADNSASNAGAAYVFVRTGSTWSQEAYLKASNTERDDLNDLFGSSVAVFGDTIVVGAQGEDSSATGVNPGVAAEADNSAVRAGAAYVFVRTGSVWSQEAYLKASNTDGNDQFGHSVAISGDTLVVGAFGEDSSATGVNAGAAAEADNSTTLAGAAYVFVRSGSVWSQEAYLKASNAGASDFFGVSVAISRNTVVVGAFEEDSNATGANAGATAEADNSAPHAGAAYVFVRSGSVWSQESYLKASNTDISDFFGSAVAVSGNTAVVGAPNEASSATGVNAGAAAEADNSAEFAGAAYLFQVPQDLGSPICSPAIPNSTGFPASLSAAGSDVAQDNDLTFFASDLPPSALAIFVTSPDLDTITLLGGGAGTLCINSPMIGRYGVVQADTAGALSFAIDLTSVPLPSSTVAVVAGDTRYWQLWYRDGATSNLSDALEIEFQ